MLVGYSNSVPWSKFTFCIVYVGASIIEGPSEVIYRPGEDPVQLTCNVTEGVIGWQLNNGEAFTIGEIRDDGDLPNHTVNGTDLVVLIPTNNTQYVCVAMTNEDSIFSAPVDLYIAGMLIISLYL